MLMGTPREVNLVDFLLHHHSSTQALSSRLGLPVVQFKVAMRYNIIIIFPLPLTSLP